MEIIQQVRIDSLDVTILRGGGKAVAKWANAQGFDLTHDAPAVLDFYAQRSPYFMAAKFDASAAVAAGFQGGDGIPVHLAIPTDNPWVPLRILGAAKVPQAPVNADVFLLTDHKPSLLYGKGFSIVQSERASHTLLDDLRSDEHSSWVPEDGWLTYGRVSGRADEVLTDLAIDVHGGTPRLRDTGAEYRRGLVLDTVPLPAPGPSAAWTVVASPPESSCSSGSAWPSATSTADSTTVFACVDRTHAVKRSIPLITCPHRTDWNPSNACCAPGSSAYADRLARDGAQRVDEVTGVLDEEQRVVRAVQHEERRRVGPHVVQRRSLLPHAHGWRRGSTSRSFLEEARAIDVPRRARSPCESASRSRRRAGSRR